MAEFGPVTQAREKHISRGLAISTFQGGGGAASQKFWDSTYAQTFWPRAKKFMMMTPAGVACFNSRLPRARPKRWGFSQWRNTHWTRLDKCQGPPGSQAWPYFLYILTFQVLGVSHLFYSTADFLVNVLRPSSSYNVWSFLGSTP